MRIALVSLMTIVSAAALAGAASPVRVEHAERTVIYEATLPRPAFAPGERVELTLTVRNRGEAPVAFVFPTAQRYDLSISRDGGAEVWRWSEDKVFAQVVTHLTLKQGEATRFVIAWDQRDRGGGRVAPGRYQAQAIFLGRLPPDSPRSLALPPLPFTIGP
ncbi:MAG: hypothetical protein HY660_18210 [Armatimonadetes bacterium]|nr:hypothetical protein [Armatimonadota bacterium]